MSLVEHIHHATILGGSAAYLALFAVGLALTLAHSLQERRGRLWQYFGDIAGVEIPDRIGVPLFFWGLTLSLWLVAVAAFFGALWPWGWGVHLSIAAVGALIGARLSDSWYSHVRLHRQGHRPNPGLGTVPLYVVEAIVLAVVFAPGLISHPIFAAVGLVAGWAVFAGVLPSLRALGALHVLSPAV